MVNESLLDDLLDRVRRWRIARGLSIRETARLAGLDNKTLGDMDAPDWAPSSATLRTLLRMMDGAAGRLPEIAPRIERLSVGVLPFRGTDGWRCLERVLKPAALEALGLDALAAVAGIGPSGLRDVGAIEYARSTVAGGAAHLVDASIADAGRFRFLSWDNSTGYRGGVDFTGSELADVNDEAYREALVGAYREVRDSGRPRISFVDRRGPDGRRTFYRVLVPLVSPGGVPQILSVTLPQEPQTARYLLANRMRV